MPGIDSFTKIMLHFDGSDASTTITDDSASAHTFTARGNAQLDTAITKFGTAALLCDGSGDYVDTPDHADFTFDSNDWTIDFWFNTSGGAGAVRRLFGQTNSSDTSIFSISAAVTAANVLNTNIVADTLGTLTLNGTTAIALSTWYHYALVRTGNTIKFFLNGTEESSGSFTLPVNDVDGAFAVGRRGESTSSPWRGSIDEFRLSLGIARWTTNFTPPTEAYSAQQDIAGVLFTNTQTFHAAQMVISQTITAALFTNSGSFFAATVSAVISISGALVTNSQTFYGATITQVDAIFAALFTNTSSFFDSELRIIGGPLGPITDLYRRTSARKRAFWEAVAASRFRSRY